MLPIVTTYPLCVSAVTETNNDMSVIGPEIAGILEVLILYRQSYATLQIENRLLDRKTD